MRDPETHIRLLNQEQPGTMTCASCNTDKHDRIVWSHRYLASMLRIETYRMPCGRKCFCSRCAMINRGLKHVIMLHMKITSVTMQASVCVGALSRAQTWYHRKVASHSRGYTRLLPAAQSLRSTSRHTFRSCIIQLLMAKPKLKGSPRRLPKI